MANRRQLLAAIAGSGTTLSAGCLRGTTLGNGTGDGNTSNFEGENDSTELTFSIASTDADPEPLSFTVEILENQLDGESFPTLSIAVENTREEPVRWAYGGSTSDLPIPNRVYSVPDRKLVLGLTGEVDAKLLAIENGCARVDRFGRDDAEITVELESGEIFEREYGIAGVDENLSGGCPERGTYRFEYVYDHFEHDEVREWGFEVTFD